MPLELSFERNEQGFRRARVPEHMEALADFLESDLQGSLFWCDEVLDRAEAIVSGTLDTWQRRGNVCSLTLWSDKAYIEHDYMPEPCSLSLGDFRDAVCRWRLFIQDENRNA